VVGRPIAIAVCGFLCLTGTTGLPLPLGAPAAAQPPAATRRLATVDALRQFPGFFHLQNVVLRGEFAEDGTRLSLRANEREIPVVMSEGVTTTTGPVEIRGQMIDVGRLEPTDPRAVRVGGRGAGAVPGVETEAWPRPGEELFVRVTAVTSAQPVIGLTVRALALEPWRWEGQKVSVVGNFRGRNLFGDLPGAPGASRYDFVVRGAEGAIWVTGQRPRGRGFDLDIDRRVDSDQWLEISGTLVHERGLVRIEAAQLALTKPPQVTDAPEEPDVPPPPPPPLEVVFSSPTDDEVDVPRQDPIRIQFSRGLDPKSVPGAIRVSYVGAPAGSAPPAFQATYDAANRALTLRFDEPPVAFSTLRVEVVDTLRAFDGGAAAPWVVTFSFGG